MKYVGSKRRIAKDIAVIINDEIKRNNIKVYVEPFVGGSNMIEHIHCEKRIGCDNNKYLIAFWKRIQEGWNPLEDVEMTKELYTDIRLNMRSYPKELVALAGFCATYNSKWFGGYTGIVKTKVGTYRDYYTEAVKNVLRQRDRISKVRYKYCDYKMVNVKGALIYCDPPYRDKTGYDDKFNHKEYYRWVREMSKDNIVLCSEYRMPKDFKVIWEKELEQSLNWNGKTITTEKLFKLKS